MSTMAVVEPVRKTLTVKCTPEHAYETFTARIGAWWPLPTHSVGGATSASVRFEPGGDGRLVEQLSDGSESVWGYVLEWDPPHRFVISWHPGHDCSRTEVHEATELEVRFTAEGEATRVELEHRGWERLGERAAEARESYHEGWDPVLARFAEAT